MSRIEDQNNNEANNFRKSRVFFYPILELLVLSGKMMICAGQNGSLQKQVALASSLNCLQAVDMRAHHSLPRASLVVHPGNNSSERQNFCSSYDLNFIAFHKAGNGKPEGP